MKKNKYILFDLDGTLTDPYEGITRGVLYALEYYGIRDVKQESLKVFIGPPLHESFSTYFGFDEDTAAAAVKKYREYFSKTGIFENELYEGIEQMLKALKENGRILGIASSKPQDFVERILEHFDIRRYFDCVCGSFLNGQREKKAEVIAAALELLDVTDREEVLMVGDRLHDVEGAKENGIACIGAGFGYGGREELERTGALAVADTVEELTKLLLEA